MSLEPGGILAWLIVGLVAVFLAGQVMKGGGYGILGDIIMGIIGAFVGGFLFSFLSGQQYGADRQYCRRLHWRGGLHRDRAGAAGAQSRLGLARELSQNRGAVGLMAHRFCSTRLTVSGNRTSACGIARR